MADTITSSSLLKNVSRYEDVKETAQKTKTSSSLLKNVSRYEDVKEAAKKTKEEMGKQEFLTLFTAQLQNQNPLEPVKNEAFVAQLAQFSQLEALTNMQGSLDKFVTSMSGERMLNSASLIGKKVAISDAATLLTSGNTLDANIALPMGASGVQINVHDSQGRLVQELIAGPQMPGSTAVTWNGKDATDNPVPTGLYRLSAVAVVNGQTTPVSVSTLSTVRAISTNPADGSVSVEVDGGKTLLLSDVKRVGL